MVPYPAGVRYTTCWLGDPIPAFRAVSLAAHPLPQSPQTPWHVPGDILAVMTERLPRLMPWAGEREWVLTMDELYSDDFDVMEIAVARIEAWRARGRLPLAVEVRCPARLSS